MTKDGSDMESQESQRYEPDAPAGGDSIDESYSIQSYDLMSIPNDFNIRTIIDFIESKAFVMPEFQRNYVWGLTQASRLIESLIVGLPVPQIFLYEQGDNKYQVIDGQQRLMSIYYFVKERFPIKKQRSMIRSRPNRSGQVDGIDLSDNNYFMDFKLSLPELTPGQPSSFHRRAYSDLDDNSRNIFDFRTIRSIIVRQTRPEGHTSIYEIFNRLNSYGTKLEPQEIRRCMYSSDFYDMLYEVNNNSVWRRFVGSSIPDVHMKDVEVLLRSFAMLVSSESYHPSLVKFLNKFSYDAKSYDKDRLNRLRQLLDTFLENNNDLPKDAFYSAKGRFSPMIFESVFVAACTQAYLGGHCDVNTINPISLNDLKNNPEFKEATQSKTTDTVNVKTRLDLARKILVSKDG